MNFKDPVVLYLNITLCIILLLLVLPVLFNTRERKEVRITYSLIFFTVIMTCLGNLFVFYFENHRLLFLQFAGMTLPYLFGPCIYFYVKFINGVQVNRKMLVHLIPASIIFLLSFYFLFETDAAKKQYLAEILKGDFLFYNIVNVFTILIPIAYCIAAKLWLRKQKVSPDEPLYAINKLKKRWAGEFVNFFLFNMSAFTAIMFVVTGIYKVSQVYTDLILMPIFMLIVYLLIAIRRNVFAQETEILYVTSRLENEASLNSQRLEISRDLHDNMGAYAIGLLYKIDYLQHAQEFSDKAIMDLKTNAEELVSLLRQNIWVLNNERIMISDFFTHFKNYALKSFDTTGVKIYFVEEVTVDRLLTAKKASNLLRILQETLQNAMKHSATERLEIQLCCNPDMKIIVRDFGNGFHYERRKEGCGIANMHHRAAEAGLILQINSEPGKGTEIRISDRD